MTPQQSIDARHRLADYFARVRAEDSSSSRRAGFRSIAPESLRLAARIVLTDAISFRQRRKADRLAHRAPLRLHLGSGPQLRKGWVNVDLFGPREDLYWNLRRPLPFPPGSVDAIFHEHVLEHFSLPEAVRLVEDSFRVLRHQGILRIGVPDLGRYIEAYSSDGAFLDEMRPGRPTRALAMQELFFRHGHRSAYDWDTLVLLTQAAGFETCERRLFGESLLDPAPDSEERRGETLYVECVK